MAHNARLTGFGIALIAFLASLCSILINKKKLKVFDKKFDEKSYLEWGGIIFSYDFHQISEILIFCIGNPIVNLMNLDDFDECSSFFSSEILYGEFNSKFSNFMSKYKLLGKLRFFIEFFIKNLRIFSYDRGESKCWRKTTQHTVKLTHPR